ncbi:replication initiation and membrane attachment family protein [Lederbergia panacisoli]|uniref:replication initiation and membrane attachment family protein n=1 Tax=Lederbergia panacisoli TaxID=1255251 RepID=UPI00214BBAC3|nr:replication initiation and membrane attachment family protein [Lederbergia panacisoli]MCR2821916.1 replication initiation and membrane attachment family protein [Lederbergia panacisoli]
MKQYWNEVQPIDAFTIVMNGILHDHDKKIISLLYQPLIGPVCASLYNTLVEMVDEGRTLSEEWNHYHLMNLFDLNLEEIYHARLKLEGIGLLKTYSKTNDNQRSFIYELQPPLSAEQFFTDGMLNIYLFQKLGQTHFLKLKKSFTEKNMDMVDFNEVTRGFQDVFTSLGANTLAHSEGHTASIPDDGGKYFHRQKSQPITTDISHFDFDLFFVGLSEVMVPRKLFTSAIKEAIAKLSFLYSINAVDMKNIVLQSLTADQKISIDDLRKNARDWYQMENDARLPQLVDKIQPMPHLEKEARLETKEDKLISYLETVSPRQLLIDLSDGGEPAKSDLQAVEDVMFQQKLLPGVTNVLIHYVMLKTDMKLSKSYLEKIASHWSRKKVKTVKSAMDLAINEHRQYQEWASGKKETSQRRNKPIRTEKLPDWFVSQDDSAQSTKQIQTEEMEERRRRLEAIQRKYQNKGGEKGGEN